MARARQGCKTYFGKSAGWGRAAVGQRYGRDCGPVGEVSKEWRAADRRRPHECTGTVEVTSLDSSDTETEVEK